MCFCSSHWERVFGWSGRDVGNLCEKEEEPREANTHKTYEPRNTEEAFLPFNCYVHPFFTGRGEEARVLPMKDRDKKPVLLLR